MNETYDDSIKKAILILGANPKGTLRLRLDEEVREIDAALQRSHKCRQFTLTYRLAARPRDIHRAILDCQPQVVHFCGHGNGLEGLAFEDNGGRTQLVHAEALANLFQLFSYRIECVLLNACYSEIQAQSISQYIDYVIGMSQSIGNRAAVNFAVGFYDALCAGYSYEVAFKLGCCAIETAGILEHLTPTIHRRAMCLTEEHLEQLISQICNLTDPESVERRRKLNRLLIEVQKLPNILKSSHSLYLEALDKTWEWLTENITQFQRSPHLSIQDSLVRWINSHLYWRIKDLYRCQNRQNHQEYSLDTVLDREAESFETRLDRLPDSGFKSPRASGIDGYLESLSNQKIQAVFEQFERYIDADPEGKLRSCHPKDRPDCNCQFLCQKLLLQSPPEKLRPLSQTLGIKHQTLNSHWKRKCLPLLQQILESLGYSGDDLL